VEQASTQKELSQLLEEIRDEKFERSDEFSSQFNSGFLEGARMALIRMKYLVSIEKSIKEKLLKV
jgi:HSCB C-terminal oligomerisation domain